MKKYQFGMVVLLLLGVLAAGALAFRGNGPWTNTQVQDAIKNNDYNAFTNALHDNNITKNVSQDQFNTIVDHYNKAAPMRAAQDAIKNNDFNAWKNAMSGFKDQSLVTQEHFDALVQMYQARQKVQQAIASNDFAGWKQAMTDLQSRQLTQEHFDQLVQHQSTGNVGFGHGRHGCMR